MKYAVPKCPECGETLAGEVELVPGRSEVFELPDEPGVFEYSGNTEMFWDGSQNERDIERFYEAKARGEAPVMDKIVRVECHNAHQWETEADYD